MTKPFKFLDYEFDQDTLSAVFRYQGGDGTFFTEQVQFSKPAEQGGAPGRAQGATSAAVNPAAGQAPTIDLPLLDRAMFLAFILLGTSYYKAHPTRSVILERPIDTFQANFFNHVYQDGLSQYAYENHLTRANLAHFEYTLGHAARPIVTYAGEGILSLQSGGKDSLLTATLLFNAGRPYTAWYLGSASGHPQVLDQLGAPLQVAKRTLDMDALRRSGGLNGHVPITYIVQSLAIIQAIINNQHMVITSIGHEGSEPHAIIRADGSREVITAEANASQSATINAGQPANHDADQPATPQSTTALGSSQVDALPVNHQWSKSFEAAYMLNDYVHRYLSPHLHVGSPLRGYSEMKISELFYQHCWELYGTEFSSCNVANYRQGSRGGRLRWCGNCAKCANAFLLFSPFVPHDELCQLFGGDLFTKPSLHDDFKGLLGVDGHIKPFECVGEIAELRAAYHQRGHGYASLPFPVPTSDYNYNTRYEMQEFLARLFE